MTHAELGRKIADEIEEKGHWQGQDVPTLGRKCIFTSDAYSHAVDIDKDDLITALVSGRRDQDLDFIYDWNDNTPTAEVLAVLRSL